MSELVKSVRMDKRVLTVVDLSDSDGDMEYWRDKSPAERLAAMELMRAIHYGYDAATTRLQRLLTIAAIGER